MASKRSHTSQVQMVVRVDRTFVVVMFISMVGTHSERDTYEVPRPL